MSNGTGEKTDENAVNRKDDNTGDKTVNVTVDKTDENTFDKATGVTVDKASDVAVDKANGVTVDKTVKVTLIKPGQHITPGQHVLLRAQGREYFSVAGEGKLHTDLGIVDLGSLEGKSWGEVVLSHKGVEFTIIKPRAPDLFRHMTRTGAPMMPKDIGAIIAYTGLCPYGRRARRGHRIRRACRLPGHHRPEGHHLRGQREVRRQCPQEHGAGRHHERRGPPRRPGRSHKNARYRRPLRRDHAGHAGRG